MKKRKDTEFAVPEIVILQHTVINVSNPIENTPTESVEELSSLAGGEVRQNMIVSDSVLKAGVLRSKLNKIAMKHNKT